jgi:hypothetical protein
MVWFKVLLSLMPIQRDCYYRIIVAPINDTIYTRGNSPDDVGTWVMLQSTQIPGTASFLNR